MAAVCRRQSSDKTGYYDLQLQEVIANGSLDFDEWTSLISDIEKLYPDDVEKICLVYDHFLSKFPLCHGYWMKYASHMTHLCTLDKVIEVFERAVLSATYSVGMWVHYCSFGMSAFEGPSDVCRLFERAISFVGKDYLCHTLWDKYIQFEFSRQQWVSLAHIYMQTLKFPTKKLHQYYNSFKKLVAYVEEDIKRDGNFSKELQSEPLLEDDIHISSKEDKIYGIIKDMLESSVGLTRSIALKRYKIIGEQLYHNACQLDKKICSFEANIQRSFFHVRPLDANQLENWHHYLDFVELQEDFDWAVKLYERCLIACAHYPEYWIRYVEFMETKGGREIANYSLERATDIFLKRVRAIHLFNARFKEQIGDVLAARAAYSESGWETDSEFVANVISKANMEKRLGNTEAAFSIYKEALEMAATKENLHNLPLLYIHFSRLKYMSSNSVDAARDVLIDGIKNLPQCKLLLEELMKFLMVHGGPVHMAMLDSVIAGAVSPRPDGSQSLSAADAEDISNLYLEFVDLCGTISDVRKAWNRHIKLFPNSVRTEIYQKSAKCRRPLDLINDMRTETCDVTPQQQSADSTTELQVQTPPQDKKFTPQNNQDISSYVPGAEVPPLENTSTQFDGDVKHNLQTEVDGTIKHNLQTEADDSAREKGRESPLGISEKPRDNYPKQHVSSLDLDISLQVSTDYRNRYSEPDASSDTLVHKTASGNETLPYSTENDAYTKNKLEHESERVKLLSLEGPSPDPHESTYPDSDTYKSNGRTVPAARNANQENSASTQDSESAQIQIETNSPSSSASHWEHITRRPVTRPQFSRNSGGNWHQMNNSGKFHRNPKFGFRGHAHRKQHQRRWRSPQRHHPTEVGPQMSPTPGYPSQSVSQLQQGSQGQSQYQVMVPYNDSLAAHSWPTNNVQLQNSASQSQMPANHTSSQVSPHLMQGQTQGQYGHIQNEQAYNQMWQYYYYQQQQQFLLQQQQQQQFQLQQSFQQDQSQQLQQQSQLEYSSQQQQQLQLQQQVLLQQQQQQFQQQQQEHPPCLQQPQPLIQVQREERELKQHEQSTLLNYNHDQQGQEEKLLQQSSEPGLVSSFPAPTLEESPQEKSFQEK